MVVNQGSRESREVGEYYARRRRVPPENVLRIDVSASENVSESEYRNGIEAPVRRAVEKSPHPIDFVVLTKGIPLRIRDDQGYSVDGHLAALFLDIPPISEPKEEQIRRSLNPFFNARERFSRARFRMLLVTRLDGYTVADAKRLVDLSLAARPYPGPFLFDGAANRRQGGYARFEELMRSAHEMLTRRGFKSVFDDTAAFRVGDGPLMGYVSWGSNDAAFDLARYRSIRFLPGAIAETFVSTSARTFRRTNEGQSLIADLVAAGVTGVKGYASEPYTFALAHPPILFDRYTAGWTLAESFYAASLVVKWKCVMIGDPLCRPYAPR